MYPFPIGVMLESFRMERDAAMERAARMGATGLQIYATRGEHTPENMTPEKIAELKNRLSFYGLAVSALCGDLGHGFSDPEMNPVNVEQSKRILDLAKELGTDIVTTHIGVIPGDPTCDKYKIMQEACFALASYADSINAHFAVETGPETAVTLKSFLDSLHSRGVAVNLDPANFVMVTGDDPVQAVYTLKDYIVHTHAKDGRRLLVMDPLVIYGEIEAQIQEAKAFIELPLGEGDVDFAAYLQALTDIGYQGYLTIEREVGDDPAADIARAVTFLQEKLKG